MFGAGRDSSTTQDHRVRDDPAPLRMTGNISQDDREYFIALVAAGLALTGRQCGREAGRARGINSGENRGDGVMSAGDAQGNG